MVQIVERTKELIKYSGFQVVPSQLEGLLLECEFVADAAVIGVWSEERATELPRAYGTSSPLPLFRSFSPSRMKGD